MEKEKLFPLCDKGDVYNFNEKLESGIYMVSGSIQNSPISASQYGVLLVVEAFFTMQILAVLTSSPLVSKFYIRIIDSPNNVFGTWTPLN